MGDRYCRLVCFMVNICTEPLRALFMQLAKSDQNISYSSLYTYLLYRQQDVILLKNNKKIKKDQYDLLYPGNSAADVKQWDITLLVTLITELFRISLQPIDEIRRTRNELQHFSNASNMTDSDFEKYWRRLETAVKTLAKQVFNAVEDAAFLKEIEVARTSNLPNLGDCLRVWYEEYLKEMKSNTTETVSVLRQLTVEMPGASVLTSNYLKQHKISSLQVDEDIVKDANRKFKEKRAIVLTGPNKCGKTSVAVALASSYNPSRCSLLTDPYDFKALDFQNTCLVIIEDFCGKLLRQERRL